MNAAMDLIPPSLAANPNFAPLMRLLEDFDKYSHHGYHRRAHNFCPRFDIRDLPNTFEVYGEVPGVLKEDLSVEFTDAKTLVVKGVVKHSYPDPAPPRGEHEDHEPAPAPANGEAGGDDAAPFLTAERGVGAFTRTFRFPCAVDRHAVEAGLEAGVLTLSVPKIAREHKDVHKVLIK